MVDPADSRAIRASYCLGAVPYGAGPLPWQGRARCPGRRGVGLSVTLRRLWGGSRRSVARRASVPGAAGVWTERHTAVALVLLVALGGAVAGLVERKPLPFWIAAAAAATAVLALFLDLWARAVGGLAAGGGA